MPQPVLKRMLATEQSYLGLDVSLNGTGLVVIQRQEKGGHWLNSFAVAHAETIQTGSVGMERLEKVANEIQIQLRRFTIGRAAIEGYAHAAKFQAHQLGEVGGQARLTLHRNGVIWREFAPTQIKLFLTGNGGKASDKKAIKSEIKRRWGLTFGDHNQADAFGLALLAALGDCRDLSRMNGVEIQLMQGK